MASREELAQALRNADAAGDTDAAQRLAQALQSMGAESAPSAQTPVQQFNEQQRRMGKGRQGDTMGAIHRARENMIYELGGRATDVTGSPAVGSVVNTAADVATDPLTYAGGGVGKLAGPALEKIGFNRMWSALKPNKFARENGDAVKAVKTLLEEGKNVSEGGVMQLTKRIDDLDSQLDALIVNSKAKLLNTDILQEMKGVISSYEAGTLGEQSVEKIKKVADSLLKHKYFGGGNEMSVQAAQKMKRQNYYEMADAYGEGLPAAAERDALKAVNRGIRKETEKAIPETGAVNAEMGPLINARDLAQERYLAANNRDMGGILWAAKNPYAFLAGLTDRSPVAQSILARLLHNGIAPYAEGVGAATGATADILGGTIQK